MSHLQFPCPSCGRQLELPSSSQGRLAQCPACLATFRVNAPGLDANPSADGSNQEPVAPQADAPSPSSGDHPDAAADPSTSPVDSATDPSGDVADPIVDSEGADAPSGEPSPVVENAAYPGPSANPFASPLESGLAASPVEEVNPYEPTFRTPPVAVFENIEIVNRSIEDIFSPTLTIFGTQLGQLMMAFIVSLFAGGLAFGGWFVTLVAIDENIGEPVFSVAFIASLPLPILLGSYLTVGLARNAIAVARNEPTPIRALLPPMAVVLRFLLGGVALVVLLAALTGVIAGFLSVVTNVINNPGVSATVLILSVFAATIVSFGLYWILWAWVFIVSDGKAGAFGALRSAWLLTMNNKLTSIFLVVIAIVLSMAGTAACYVGLLITQPLTNLMFAVAYLLMTNQIISTGREAVVFANEQDEFWQ